MCCHPDNDEEASNVNEFLSNFLEEKLLTPTSENNSLDSGVSSVSSRAASDIAEVRMMTDLKMPASLTHCGYTSDWEEEDLPPLPAPSLTSLHCGEVLPPPPGPTQDTLLITPTPAQDTLLLIPAPATRTAYWESASKEKTFRTFFEDVWFEESSYNA